MTVGNLFLGAAAAIFLLVVGVGISRRPDASVRLLAWIAVPQAALLVGLALRTGDPALWADAAVTLAIKGICVPALVRRRALRPAPDFGLASAASPALLLFGAAAASALGLRLGAVLVPDAGPAFGLCLAAMFLGFGMPSVRAELWSQVTGILAGEGALAGSLFVLVGGLPVLVEGLVLADVLVFSGVLGGVVRRVHRVHGRPDARLLERLRG